MELELPENWDVSVYEPRTGPPLSDDELADRFESPLDQLPIRERCTPTTRPLIIVDDLNRPTPAARVLPFLVRQFTDAGVPAENITILIGSGTHAPPSAEGAAKKVGADVMQTCRVCIHDCNRNLVKVGTTSFGTPVVISRQAIGCDFLVAVGGMYPNYTAGFGGGSKAALGVLGLRSIAALHFGHPSTGRGAPPPDHSFRRDLDEIARLIGLETGVFVVVDADREIVDVAYGDIHALYPRSLTEAAEAFRAPRPDPSARVVISNAYPNDLSLTFVRMKGMAPLAAAPRGASRVVVASCSEGLGFHGLFPLLNAPRFHRQRMLRRRVAANLHQPRRFAGKVSGRVARRIRRDRRAKRDDPAGLPIWLYCPSTAAAATLPPEIPGIRVSSSWPEIVSAVNAEQNHDRSLPTIVYSAAPLQWFD